MKPAAVLLAGVVLVAGFSLAIALPQGGMASLLDVTAQRLPPPPEIRLTAPSDGDGVDSLVRVAGVARGAARDVIDVQVRVDGARWESVPDAPRGQQIVPFSHEVALGAGDHLLEARAWDGEAYSIPARAQLRRGAPTLVLAEPQEGAGVERDVTVAGTIVGSASAVVIEAGGTRTEAAVLPSGAWSAHLRLDPGVREIRAHARAATPSLPRSATVSVEGPEMSLLSPSEASSYGEAGDLACGGGCILFTGASERAQRIELVLDGRPTGEAQLAPAGTWTYRLPMLGLANGTHRANFVAIDDQGATSAPRGVVFLARTPIELRIDGDLDPRPTRTPLHFEARGEHAATTVWTLDGEVVGEGGTLDLQLDRPGDHSLVARTRPSSGTAATSSVGLHALNRAPSVRLHSEALALGGTARIEAEASDPDGRVVEYLWDFGDGKSAVTSQASVERRFPQRGWHQVDLIVRDEQGATARDSQLVFVPNGVPLVEFAWEPADPTILDVVNFSDGSRDLDGLLTARTWSFPDGTTTENATPSFRFAAPGDHPVALTVLDDDGAVVSATKMVHVRNLAPAAAFQHAPLVPQADEDVLFSDRSVDPEGRIVSWRWEFGDGTGANTSAALHRYADPGEYEVSLTVADHLGAVSTVTRSLRISESAPSLHGIVLDPPDPRGGESVAFRAVGRDREGGLASFHWEFGDGANSTAAEPTHRYMRSGTYLGRVTAYDGAGLSSVLPFTVHVTNAPPTAQLRLVEGGYAAFPSILVADAIDVDGRVALYRFDADGDGAADCEVALPRCAFTYEKPGVYGARVWVEDDERAIAEAQTIVEMQPPPSHLVPPTVRVGAPGEHATLRGEYLLHGDAAGVRAMVKVELQLQQGTWAYSGSADPWRLAVGASPWTSLFDTRPFPDGAYELVVRATDAGGGVGFARIPVTIQNGARPNEVSVQLMDVPDLLLDDALIRGSAYHPQGVSSVRWRIDEGSWRFIGASPLDFSIPLDIERLGPGEHVLEVEAFRGTTERARTNATFRVPGEAPVLVIDEAPPPVAHGLLRATGRVVGAGHAQWKLDHGLWKDLPPGDWLLAEETMRIPGGAHEVHLRAMGPEGLASNVTTYAFRVVNPPPPRAPAHGEDATETRATPAAGALGLLTAMGAAAMVARRRT